VNCRDGDALYLEFKAKGEITRAPEVTLFEIKEFELKDCNGYIICFGQDAFRAGVRSTP
jgi:hypothetical protein